MGRAPEFDIDPSPLRLLTACGGYYRVPQDADGNYLGPLVGYAGTYEEGKQYVGLEFANFAKIERFPWLADQFVVEPLARELGVGTLLSNRTVISAAPLGGLSLGTLLSRALHREYGFPDSVERTAATATSRAVKELRFGRHEVPKGARVIITEDVCNNFSTTGKFIDEIRRNDGEVTAIACFLNRSLEVDDVFEYDGKAYPVIARWRQAIPEYRQDHPVVAEEIRKGNVIWKPKDRWAELPQ